MFRIKCLDMSPKYRKRGSAEVGVSVSLDIVSISSLNLVNMEVSLDFHITQTWTDENCRFRVKIF